MIIELDWNLLWLVDKADAQGRVTLDTKFGGPVRSKDTAREWLLRSFYRNQLLNLRLDRVKKAISEIEVSWTATSVSFNLARLLLLPGAAPAQELAEFREMLAEMKAFFETHKTERVDFQLCNERTQNGRVYGSLRARVPSGEHKMGRDEAVTASLNARIEGSPALSHWLRQVALSLQKMGPYSWALILEDDLYGERNGPHCQYLYTRPRTPEQEAARKLRKPLKLED